MRETFSRKHWHDFIAGVRAAVGVSVSVSDCAVGSQSWRQAGLEEDVWTLWLSFVFVLLRESEATLPLAETSTTVMGARDVVSAWLGVLQRRYGRQAAGEVDGGEDEELLEHVDELFEEIRREIPGSGMWSGAWEVRRLCGMIVKEESVGVGFSKGGYGALRKAEREMERMWEEGGRDSGKVEEVEEVEEMVGLYVCIDEEY